MVTVLIVRLFDFKNTQHSSWLRLLCLEMLNFICVPLRFTNY
jgi:hypothetical protein